MATLIVIWQLVVDNKLVPRFILPAPTDIMITLINIFPGLSSQLLITLKEAMIGFILAIAFSLILAILMDIVVWLKKAIYPILVVSQTIPIIALAPLFALWFGFGELPKVLVVVLVCFFPIVINLVDGMASVDPDMLNLFRSMGASSLQVFGHLKIPAAMTYLFSGLRVAATYSIMGAVIGEWLGGEGGLGVYMIRAKHSYALDKVFAVILVIVILSMVLFKLIAVLQNILMPWQKLLTKKQREVGSNE